MSLQLSWCCWYSYFGLNKCRQNLLLWEIPSNSRSGAGILCVFCRLRRCLWEIGQNETKLHIFISCPYISVITFTAFPSFCFPLVSREVGKCFSLSRNAHFCSLYLRCSDFHLLSGNRHKNRHSCWSSQGGCWGNVSHWLICTVVAAVAGWWRTGTCPLNWFCSIQSYDSVDRDILSPAVCWMHGSEYLLRIAPLWHPHPYAHCLLSSHKLQGTHWSNADHLLEWFYEILWTM